MKQNIIFTMIRHDILAKLNNSERGVYLQLISLWNKNFWKPIFITRGDLQSDTKLSPNTLKKILFNLVDIGLIELRDEIELPYKITYCSKLQSKIDSEQSKIDSEQSKIDSEQSKIDSEQSKIDSEQSKIDRKVLPDVMHQTFPESANTILKLDKTILKNNKKENATKSQTISDQWKQFNKWITESFLVTYPKKQKANLVWKEINEFQKTRLDWSKEQVFNLVKTILQHSKIYIEQTEHQYICSPVNYFANQKWEELESMLRKPKNKKEDTLHNISTEQDFLKGQDVQEWKPSNDKA